MNAEMATTTRSRIAAPPAVEVASDWTIDTTYTLVQFAVKYLGFTTARGRFTDVRGAIHCGNQADPAASVEATIAATSVATGDFELDASLRSADFLEAERYPTITFTSTRVERTAKGRFRVTGDLTIRNVTRVVVLDTTYTGRGTDPRGQEVAGYIARTRFRVNRKDYGLTWNPDLEGGILVVGDTLQVRVELRVIKRTSLVGSRRNPQLKLVEFSEAKHG